VASDASIREILDLWFAHETRAKWFKPDPAFDASLRERFASAAEAAGRDEHDAWLASPEGALALVLLLDQIPRNVWRGTPGAYRFDAKARAVADSAIAAGHDGAVEPDRRMFFYLPFEHSESLADQERAMALFGALGDPDLLEWARRHHEIVARFGRFPHRNAVLGRESTPEELAFLTEPNSSF
jgi:uncharacterized protein (DUF924 family)